MNVRVKLFGLLPRRFPGYDPEKGMEVELPPEARVKDLLAQLDISKEEGGIVAVEGLVQKAEAELRDGSVLHVFHPIVGG
ncbi:MAG: MoaD/ThiS family protein [Deltaproteobacteria bacterium]|nr:MoaD/ThiS family protein [Deltaproteobacteria bacterium]